MPETGELVRYALKLATGCGKTLVMAAFIVWSTLHKRKVSGSSLSANFLVLVPNLTVRDRVSGVPRGDGLEAAGAEKLYDAFELVPPEYREEFQTNVTVKNWQAIPLEFERADWIKEDLVDEGRFVPASVLWAMQRRARRDPNAAMRRFLGNWRDVVIMNDEAHHVYGVKRARKSEEPEYIKWSKIIERIGKAARISLVIDLSATPWYGSGSQKPDGTLFEWLVSDFSVYDAFESGLVKVVRLPETDGSGSAYLDLWDAVKDAKTKEEYISGCKGAIASMYSSWRQDYEDWLQRMQLFDEPSPVMLLVANDATRAGWLFEHVTKDYELLRNPDEDDRRRWMTIQVDSRTFDSDKGNEAILREMVNTVGKKGFPGEHVRCIVSVNMLSEGWDVKSVTHMLGLRAFGSPLLTEQVIGRGLRRTNYDVLNQPVEERSDGAEETVDAFGIPLIGFPVEKRKRPKAGQWGNKPVWIEPDDAKGQYRVSVPNVRSWAVDVTDNLRDVIRVAELPELVITPKETPTDVRVRPVVGGKPEAIMTLKQFREEYPLLKTIFMTAGELLELLSPGEAGDMGIGPTFDELLGVTSAYFEQRLLTVGTSDPRDAGIYYWRQRAINVLETAIRNSKSGQTRAVPILGDPEYLDSRQLKRFQWTGITVKGRKCHTSLVPCHTDLERQFADFLDGASDVIRYFKNERLGFSVTYYENNRPRQYYPDFVVLVREADEEVWWLAETKGEIRPNTALKQQAAEAWCEKMSGTRYGHWQYVLVRQQHFNRATAAKVKSFADLVTNLSSSPLG